MNFEILIYEKAGDTDSLKSTLRHVDLDLNKKNEVIKQEVQNILEKERFGKFSFDKIEIDEPIGIVEIYNEQGKEIIQFRSNE